MLVESLSIRWTNFSLTSKQQVCVRMYVRGVCVVMSSFLRYVENVELLQQELLKEGRQGLILTEVWFLVGTSNS